MFIEDVQMKDRDTNEIRTAFLRASYHELFGSCPEAAIIDQLITESTGNGRQRS